MQENDIRKLLKNLVESINETLAESAKINETMQEIKDSGYEVFLIVEAKIGVNRKNDEEQEAVTAKEPVRLNITHDDAKFLKALRISSNNI